MPRTGRRPGAPRTRQAILDAARKRFATDGYRGATIRSIAVDAGVDPALVHHYFGTKQDLFVSVLDLPAKPETVVAGLLERPPEAIGTSIVRTFLSVWDQADRRERMQILIRSALVDETAARMIREFLLDALFVPIAWHFAPDQHELRATLVASQMAGFAFVRYILGIEPLASAGFAEVETALGPTIQRYLTDPL